jgi:hypothetical protein
MSINLPTHYVQQYSTNVALLLQQQGSKLRDTVTTGSHVGKAASPVDQIGKVEMQTVTGRFNPMSRVDAPTDRRWVYPSDFDLPQLIDSFDMLRLISDPKASYSRNAALAAGRKMDAVILAAVLGTAKTGETGGTNTSFTSGNEVDVAVGGANSRLNVAKLRECRRLMMAKHIDLDAEMPVIAITAQDHDALLGEIQVVSRDFNGGAPVLQSGKISEFMGFKFVHCELVETVLAGTNEVTLPVWVKSGMYLGMWNDFDVTVTQRDDLQGLPWQLYTKMTIGATRLEEDRVFAIESYRA